MEYIAIGIIAVLSLVAVFVMKNPSKLSQKIAKNVLDIVSGYVKEREADIVLSVYNNLPKEIKSRVGSKTVADIVAYAIDAICGIVSEIKEK